MKSFREQFCAAHGCSGDQFCRRVFWACLNLHAQPIAVLLGGSRSNYFSLDRELIAGVGRATSMAHVREEISDYFVNPSFRGWLRRRVHIRISTTKLKALAKVYLEREEQKPHVPDRKEIPRLNGLEATKASG